MSSMRKDNYQYSQSHSLSWQWTRLCSQVCWGMRLYIHTGNYGDGPHYDLIQTTLRISG